MNKKKAKQIIRPFTLRLIQTKLGKVLQRRITQLAEYLRYEKSLYEREVANNHLKEIFADLTVRYGPFEGLVYPSFKSVGSSIFPKLAGVYETELHFIFNQITQRNYDKIIDIGAAEGYYAVGLARIFPSAQVYTFDINANARELCKEMAKINGVLPQFNIKGACTEHWLLTEPTDKKTFIISDCEGAEVDLFTEKVAKNLLYADILIELHPRSARNIKEKLSSIFNPSHDIHFVSSQDDRRKIFELDSTFQSLPELEKLIIVQEGRTFTTDWMYLTSKGKIS